MNMQQHLNISFIASLLWLHLCTCLIWTIDVEWMSGHTLLFNVPQEENDTCVKLIKVLWLMLMNIRKLINIPKHHSTEIWYGIVLSITYCIKVDHTFTVILFKIWSFRFDHPDPECPSAGRCKAAGKGMGITEHKWMHQFPNPKHIFTCFPVPQVQDTTHQLMNKSFMWVC